MGTTANASPVGPSSGISYRSGEATGKARIAVLTEEMHSIHHANRLFWEQKAPHNREAITEYYRRQERLEEIRRELTGLIESSRYPSSPPPVGCGVSFAGLCPN